MRRAYLWLFLLFWLYCYVLYPAWYVPETAPVRLLIFAAILTFLLANAYLLHRWLNKAQEPLFPQIDKSVVLAKIKENLPLVYLLCLYVILQIYPLSLPLKTLGDEHYHVYVSIPIIRLLSRYSPLPLPFLTWVVVIFALAVWQFWKKKKLNLKEPLLLSLIVIVALIYAVILVRSGLMERINPEEHLFRFPPLGKTVHLISYLLFGVSVFTARLPQLVFYVLAAVYVYRIGLLYRNKLTAFNAAALFLFTPAIFHFGHIGFLSGGVLFLCAASFFYFARYLKEEHLRDLLLAVFFSGVGFLYKRVLLAILIILFTYLILRDLVRRKNLGQNLKSHLALGWLASVSAIPWLLIGNMYSPRNYTFRTSNWLGFENITYTLRLIPEGGTYLMYLLFAVGIFYAVRKRRDELTYFSFLYFLMYYVFVNSERWRVMRLALPIWLPVFILTAQFLAGGNRGKKLKWLISLLFAGYLIVASTFLNIPPLEGRFTLAKDIQKDYAPYEQLFVYVKENLPPGSRIYAPAGCEPSHFYLYHYQLEGKYTWERKFWIKDKPEQSRDNLYEFCKKEDFSYLVFAEKEWVEQWINKKVVEELYAGQDPRFKVKKAFTFGNNQIILWEVAD